LQPVALLATSSVCIKKSEPIPSSNVCTTFLDIVSDLGITKFEPIPLPHKNKQIRKDQLIIQYWFRKCHSNKLQSSNYYFPIVLTGVIEKHLPLDLREYISSLNKKVTIVNKLLRELSKKMRWDKTSILVLYQQPENRKQLSFLLGEWRAEWKFCNELDKITNCCDLSKIFSLDPKIDNVLLGAADPDVYPYSEIAVFNKGINSV